jgi:hypothetical protein
MIVSKPKFSTLFSLGAFLVLGYALAIWSVISWPDEPAWYRYLITGFLWLVALLVSIKVFGGYRIIRLNKDKWHIRYLLFRKSRSLRTTEIEWWRLSEVDTKGGTYQELHLFGKGTHFKVSPQEHTAFPQILSYVQRKCAKKRLKAE